jgi:hypothetical protein
MLVSLILSVVLWGCTSIENSTIFDSQPINSSFEKMTTRTFPDFSIQMPSPRDLSLAPSPVITSVQPAHPGPTPQLPPGQSPKKPYAFIRVTSPSAYYGQIYYSSGESTPSLILSSGHTVTPSGEWVFFIQPPGANPPGPARYNTVTHSIEYLDTSMVDPLCNYLVPADDGNAYIYGEMNISGANALQGWTHIVIDGVKVFSIFGSYFFPTISSDASTAGWCYDSNPSLFGDRDAYIMDIESEAITKIHNCTSSQEAQWISLTEHGKSAAFSVAINGSDGIHDQEIWAWHNGRTIKIPTGDYRWCERTMYSTRGKYIVFHGNKDPYLYSGYAVLCSLEGTQPAYELTTYDQSIQKIWPDVDDNGYVIYGNGVGLWSHYIPSCTHVEQGELGTIIDPGAISRDFKFEN